VGLGKDFTAVHAANAHAASAPKIDNGLASRSRRLIVACLAFGLTTAAGVFVGAMAVAQPSDAGAEFVVVRTMYAGHDGSASCPGIAEVKADSGDQVTYCYAMTNSSDVALERIAFVDAATGADTSFMAITAGEVPVPVGGQVMWAFETRATTALAGPAPTPTATATPAPTATAVPTATAIPAPTATAIPTATAESVVVITTATPDPTAIPADPTTATGDPTAIAVAPSAPAPPAASTEVSILDTTAVIGNAATMASGTAVLAIDAVEPDAPAMAIERATIEQPVAGNAVMVESAPGPQGGRTTLVPIATSSGWRLGNTTAAMVLSVLIAVAAGLAAGVAFWHFARHLQKRRSALYWYERLAV